MPKEFEGITVYYSPKTVFEGDLKVTISENNYTTIYSSVDVLGDGSPIEIVLRGNIVRSKNSYSFTGNWKNQLIKYKIDFLTDNSLFSIIFPISVSATCPSNSILSALFVFIETLRPPKIIITIIIIMNQNILLLLIILNYL